MSMFSGGELGRLDNPLVFGPLVVIGLLLVGAFALGAWLF